MFVNKKALSTLIIIILLLCSVVFGALVSYLWVMSSYYNMPENTTMLIVEEVVFPDFPNLDCTYFNVTILNPSNSLSDANITAIQLTVKGKNEVWTINTTEPEINFTIRRGTRQTFKCLKNWSDFAGQTVEIEPVAANISALSYSCQTPNVKLTLQPTFKVEESVEYFNLTVINSGALNLTISDIIVQTDSIKNNVTPPLPIILSPEQNETFKCYWNWDWRIAGIQDVNVTIRVKTTEGYETTYKTNALPGAYLYIEEIKFDYSDTTYFNLTISSSPYSTATAVISGINLTLQDTTFPINETRQRVLFKSLLPIFRSIPKNESKTFECYWDWTLYRNTSFIVNVYTEQGFLVDSKNVSTPPDVVWNITNVSFDLDDINYFLVNVTNMPCSLRNITVTQIWLNETSKDIQPPSTLSNGTQEMFNCPLSWADFRGKTANVTVVTTEGSISRLLEVSAVGLKILEENLVCGDFYGNTTEIAVPYINVTISNSNNSLYNVTITQIIIQTRNDTYIIYNNATYHQYNSILYPRLRPDGYAPTGYPLNIGETVTFVCSWNYESYLSIDPITVTIYTAEGFQASKTWYP
ncbi:MAG: hypothetical protein QXQ94_00325 [Candidatus Bathyarchaeia archaeon]